MIKKLHIDSVGNPISGVFLTDAELAKINKLRRDLRLYLECVESALIRYSAENLHRSKEDPQSTAEEEHLTKILDELDALDKEGKK